MNPSSTHILAKKISISIQQSIILEKFSDREKIIKNMGLLEHLGSMDYAFDNNLPAILDNDSSNPTYVEYLHYRLNSGGIIVFNHPAAEVSSLKENFCVAFYHVLRYVKNNIDAARAIENRFAWLSIDLWTVRLRGIFQKSFCLRHRKLPRRYSH